MSSSSLFTPLQFTGISQYSSDFQSILTRAVSIAQLPAQALQQQQTQITQQEADLGTLNSDVSAVQTALVNLGKLGSGGALSASSSDSSVVTATNTGSTLPASYSITNVTSLATAASGTSGSFASSTTTPVSTTGTMSLVIGSSNYTITLAAGQNNLVGLQTAINNLGAGVNASILTTGSAAYLSVSANSPGATTLQLNDDPSGANHNIFVSGSQGSNTNFELNNVAVSAPNTTINSLIPGVTLSFTGKTSSSETVTVGLATDRTQISSALQQLASSYNTLLTAQNAQLGTGGSLAGNNIVYQISQALSSIVQYHGGTGGMAGLANLGIEIDQTGQMSLNTNTFSALTDSQISSALGLLGSSTTGIGGLQQTFAALTDPTSGTIATQENQWSATVTKLSSQISAISTKVSAMEQTLNRQLQAADASVAELASQQNILTASITSLDYTAYGYNSSSSTSKST